MKDKEPISQNLELVEEHSLNESQSLQSVNFAPSENHYLNEHTEDHSQNKE
jgi:hypothetical protein